MALFSTTPANKNYNVQQKPAQSNRGLLREVSKTVGNVKGAASTTYAIGKFTAQAAFSPVGLAYRMYRNAQEDMKPPATQDVQDTQPVTGGARLSRSTRLLTEIRDNLVAIRGLLSSVINMDTTLATGIINISKAMNDNTKAIQKITTLPYANDNDKFALKEKKADNNGGPGFSSPSLLTIGAILAPLVGLIAANMGKDFLANAWEKFKNFLGLGDEDQTKPPGGSETSAKPNANFVEKNPPGFELDKNAKVISGTSENLVPEAFQTTRRLGYKPDPLIEMANKAGKTNLDPLMRKEPDLMDLVNKIEKPEPDVTFSKAPAVTEPEDSILSKVIPNETLDRFPQAANINNWNYFNSPEKLVEKTAKEPLIDPFGIVSGKNKFGRFLFDKGVEKTKDLGSYLKNYVPNASKRISERGIGLSLLRFMTNPIVAGLSDVVLNPDETANPEKYLEQYKREQNTRKYDTTDIGFRIGGLDVAPGDEINVDEQGKLASSKGERDFPNELKSDYIKEIDDFKQQTIDNLRKHKENKATFNSMQSGVTPFSPSIEYNSMFDSMLDKMKKQGLIGNDDDVSKAIDTLNKKNTAPAAPVTIPVPIPQPAPSSPGPQSSANQPYRSSSIPGSATSAFNNRFEREVFATDIALV